MVLVPCPQLVGREDEFGSLRRALADAADRRGRVIVVTGEAGVGKSRLLHELRDEAGRRGMPVLVGRAVESASPVAFRPFAEALFAHVRRGEWRSVSALAPFQSVLDRLSPGWAAGRTDDADASTVIVAEAVLRLLGLVGEGSGCLLALEDLHWADAETMDVLEYLADNTADQALLCVATMRDDEETPARRKVGALVARRAVTALGVRRLDRVAAEAMAAACLAGDEALGSLRTKLALTAEGLPFLIEELLVAAAEEASDERGRAPDSAPVPESFAETVRRRLRAAPGIAEVLRPAALLGRSFDWDLLPAVTGLSDDEAIARLRGATEARLIDLEAVDNATRFRFRHALSRAAILADLFPTERAALAARVLSVVDATHAGLPGEWCELAAELAEHAGQAHRAADLFLEAGRRALKQGALATAERSLHRARRLAVDEPSVAVEVDDALCSVLALGGDNAGLEEVGARLLAGLVAVDASATRIATVHLRLARAAAAAADWATAERHLRLADELGVELLRTEGDLLAAEVALGRDEPVRAEELARRALAGAERRGQVELACGALEVVGRRERQRDVVAAERSFTAALDLAESHGLRVWRIRALHELGTIDLLAGGPLDRLAEARTEALAAGALATAATVGLQIAAWQLNHVELDGVIETARAFSAEAHRLRMPVVEALGSVLTASAYAMRGQRADMDRAIATALGLAGDVPEVRGGALLQARASYWLVREDRARALAALDEGMDLLRPTLATTPFRGMWALVHAVDDRDGAAAIAEVEASGLMVYWLIRGWVEHARAVMLGRAGRHREALDAFAAGDDTLAPSDWYRQHARRLVAEAAIADGWGDPATWLTGALAYFDANGDDRVASACRSLLRRAGATVPRRARPAHAPGSLAGLGLTARELEVLSLLGEARATRDIASELFVSPKTVERHIANLAAKVGVRGRAELIAFAASQEPRSD